MRPSKITQELFKNSLNDYKTYIDSLPLSNEIKVNLHSDGISHASFYLFYPHLFKDAFYIKKSEEITLLSVVSFPKKRRIQN